jgi:hypothetical protein
VSPPSSSETSVQFKRSTLRHIPEDGILHSHRCENLKSYKNVYGFEGSLGRLILVNMGFREGKALGSEEGKALGREKC